MDAVIEAIRPSVLLPDRDSRLLETTGNREIVALEKLSMLVAKTSIDLVDQWKSEFMALAFSIQHSSRGGWCRLSAQNTFPQTP